MSVNASKPNGFLGKYFSVFNNKVEVWNKHPVLSHSVNNSNDEISVQEIQNSDDNQEYIRYYLDQDIMTIEIKSCEQYQDQKYIQNSTGLFTENKVC